MPIEMDDAECDGHAEGMLTAPGGVGGRDQQGGWRQETMRRTGVASGSLWKGV